MIIPWNDDGWKDDADDWDRLSANMAQLEISELIYLADYTATARDIAQKRGDTYMASFYESMAVIASEALESQLRLRDAVDDAVNPFQALGDPERPE